ncbi:hypothetical protein MBLNU230_g6455t1 [Neophaeotheca triangularis]
MADEPTDNKQGEIESDVRDMHIKEEASDMDMDTPEGADAVKKERSRSQGLSRNGTSTPKATGGSSRSSVKPENIEESPALSVDEDEETVGGDIILKQEPGKAPKLTRSTSHKVEKRPPPLFLDYDDRTEEAVSTFEVISQCTYANKYLGTTETALECDCAEEWDASTRTNIACDEDSDCINRATKMECVGDCGCGTACQNQRFQRKAYANVTIIKTEKKGHGLRANVDLKANDFIFEYIGEVIGEQSFRRRMQHYDQEGIKHFYFMSLSKGEFVDATKRGNLGRFCNHSCNPNCYVDKWVVGDKLRMGIFAERKIQAGEELVFNYNVDRYGADPQPCYCDEPNCTGYIGGKTQTERATKLSHATIEALGIDDADAWDTAVAKKPRKKKMGEDDEEYVNNVEPKGLEESGVTKVMATLMQCKEKWIAVKLLSRLQRAEDEKVRNRVVKMHGYQILNTALTTWTEDVNVVLQVLDILYKLPRLTRNKIQDSKIEGTVEKLTTNEDDRVAAQSKRLLEDWSKLEVAYRIPRMKRDPNAVPDRKLDRREGERRRSKSPRRSRSKSKSPDRAHAPTGPRSSDRPRGSAFFAGSRGPPRFRPPPPPGGALPPGWFEATAANGSTYYYNAGGTTTWVRPTIPAARAPPPPPPKAISDQQALQDLIKNIVSTKSEPAKQPSASATPVETPVKQEKEPKWKSMSEDKKRKLYENTLQPHIQHVVNKYKHKLARDDLKRFAKDMSKKLVNSDFKRGRVEDPSRISDKQAKGVKKAVQEYFDKAVEKQQERDKKKGTSHKPSNDRSTTPAGSPSAGKEEDDVILSENEIEDEDNAKDSPAISKRTRESDGEDAEALSKKQRTSSVEAPPAPPPPPPPPNDDPNLGAMDVDPSAQQPDQVLDFINNSAGDVSKSQVAAAKRQVNPNRKDRCPPRRRRRPLSNATNTLHSSDLSNGLEQPMQTATPPFTNTPDRDREEGERQGKKENYGGMNPDRMRQLGISMDGAGE